MKLLLCLLAFSLSCFADEKICGVMDAKSGEDSLHVNVVDRDSELRTQNFAVLNPLAVEWVAGSCLCLEGQVSYDPQYGNDSLFKRILVTQNISEDSSGKACLFVQAN